MNSSAGNSGAELGVLVLGLTSFHENRVVPRASFVASRLSQSRKNLEQNSLDFPVARAEFHRVPGIRARLVSWESSHQRVTLVLSAVSADFFPRLRWCPCAIVTAPLQFTAETPPLQGGNATAHGSDVT
eukprot:3345097-Rhodomonas_salina.1